jgi:hypothetical protein
MGLRVHNPQKNFSKSNKRVYKKKKKTKDDLGKINSTPAGAAVMEVQPVESESLVIFI